MILGSFPRLQKINIVGLAKPIHYVHRSRSREIFEIAGSSRGYELTNSLDKRYARKFLHQSPSPERMQKRSYKRKSGRKEAHLLVGKIFDEEQQVALKVWHPIVIDAILLRSNHHLFLDHGKPNISKKMIMAPHSHKSYPLKSGPFNVIPSAILSKKD